jgi:hypothetical protein
MLVLKYLRAASFRYFSGDWKRCETLTARLLDSRKYFVLNECCLMKKQSTSMRWVTRLPSAMLNVTRQKVSKTGCLKALGISYLIYGCPELPGAQIAF